MVAYPAVEILLLIFAKDAGVDVVALGYGPGVPQCLGNFVDDMQHIFLPLRQGGRKRHLDHARQGEEATVPCPEIFTGNIERHCFF